MGLRPPFRRHAQRLGVVSECLVVLARPRLGQPPARIPPPAREGIPSPFVADRVRTATTNIDDNPNA